MSDLRLHVVSEGDLGTPIVFVHGLGTSADSWSEVMVNLRTDHRVLAVDLLGHGRSPAPDDPAEYTRDRALAVGTLVTRKSCQVPGTPLRS